MSLGDSKSRSSEDVGYALLAFKVNDADDGKGRRWEERFSSVRSLIHYSLV